jgi:hypothetical protein
MFSLSSLALAAFRDGLRDFGFDFREPLLEVVFIKNEARKNPARRVGLPSKDATGSINPVNPKWDYRRDVILSGCEGSTYQGHFPRITLGVAASKGFDHNRCA